jgi:hypothetical protein
MATTTKREPAVGRDGGSRGSSGAERAAETRVQAAPLDMLLSEAAIGPAQRWNPGIAGLKTVGNLAVQPRTVARWGARLAAELTKIALGRSDVGPRNSDRRFKDPAWSCNPAFRRLGQTYLAAAAALDGLLCDVELDWSEERRVRFAAENVIDAIAPTNFPLTNPAVLKAALDTGGGNFVKGLGHFVSDMASRPRIPSMVDRSSFKVGENLAITPGAVVFRTDVFELLQYEPQTSSVRELGSQYLCRRGGRGARRRADSRRLRAGSRPRPVRGRDHACHRGRIPGRTWRARPFGWADARRMCARQRACRHHERVPRSARGVASDR